MWPNALAVKLGLLGVLLVVVYLGAYQQGKRAVQADWNASKTSIAEAQQALILENQKRNWQMREDQNAAAVKVSEDHQRSLDELRKDYDAKLAAARRAGGLLLPATICSGPARTAAEAASPSRHNDSPAATVALPERTTASLFNLAKEADEVSEQLRACQAWINKNGFYH